LNLARFWRTLRAVLVHRERGPDDLQGPTEEDNVTDTPSIWGVTRARVVALGVMLALAPFPAAAADTPPQTPSSIDLKAAVRKFAAAERLSKSASAAQPAAQAGDAKLQSPSFFKTPLGLAVIAVVGGGAAYAVYSAQHDRIHSAVR
jgi:hypothetical protein